MTQIRMGAKIGISELICCMVAPFIYMREYHLFKRDGVSLYFNLALLWILGALFSDFYNHSFFQQLIRGFPVPLTIFCVSVCIYHNLRRHPRGLKWLIFGIALSSVLSIFVFQRGRSGDLALEEGMAAGVEAVVGYKLFWSNMAKTWLSIPVQCCYLNTPLIYTIPALLGVSFINMLAGGRSAFAMSFLGFLFVIIGGKTIASISRVKKFLPMILGGVAVMVLAIKGAYSYAAEHGYLNEAETLKYEKQTARGSDIMSLLISGRGDFFIGLQAALDKPIIGHGSQALDTYGYERDYIIKYGTAKEQEDFAKDELQGYLRTIRAHSHIICYWMWHGIFALLFWVYILVLMIKTIRKRLSYIPEWYGYLTLFMCDFMWDFFFSPFGLRVNECTFFCAMLMLVRIEKLNKGRY